MKTLEVILAEYQSNALDGRDVARLMDFIPEDKLPLLGIELKEEYIGKHEAKPLTKENVLAQLERDVAFGFDKALSQRGISSSLMFAVVMMWNWVLEDGLEDWDEDDYAQYGLPLFKATAIKYGFDNPIREDSGSEYKYSTTRFNAMITIKSPRGGFLAIIPVTGCGNRPFRRDIYCTHDDSPDGSELGVYRDSRLTQPLWCPAIAEGWDNTPGSADLDFLLQDAIESLQGEAP